MKGVRQRDEKEMDSGCSGRCAGPAGRLGRGPLAEQRGRQRGSLHRDGSGQISARSAPITNVPRQEGTSNFDECVGQSYAFVHGELLLFYDGRWNYCVHSEDPAWMGIQVMTVMVDGALYHTYGEEAPAPEADQISGQISARFVAGSVLPKEDDTSNFEACVGQPYAFVNGELLLYYGGQWNRCVPAEVHQLDPP